MGYSENNKNISVNLNDLPQIFPLNDSQKGIYLEYLSNPQSLNYILIGYYTFPKNVDIDKLRFAIKTSLNNHAIFHYAISSSNGVPSMVYKKQEIIVSEKETDDILSELKTVTKPFDLENGPLFLFEICHAKDAIYLAFNVHHIIFDGTSFNVFLREIIKSYNGEKLDKEGLTIFDYSKLESDKNEKNKEISQNYFKKYDGLDFDLNPASDVPLTIEQGLGTFTINSETKSKAVEEFAKKNNVSENAVLLGAFAYALAKISGENETFFCTAHHGRLNKGLANTFGMFVKTLPIYSSFTEDAKVVDFLKSIYDEYYNVKHNDAISFPDLANKYSLSNDITFIFESDIISGSNLNGMPIDLNIVFLEAMVKFDMMVLKKNGVYEVSSHNRRDIYSDDFSLSLTKLFLRVLEEMLVKDKLQDIDFISSEEQNLYRRLNATETEYDEKTNVVDLFRKVVKESPQNICVSYHGKNYSYKEVDLLTDNIAKYLVSIGVKKEDVVGVLIPRCELMVIASLAILKAGGAYLPLDPTYPPERLNLMVQDSKATVLIYDKEFSDVIDDEFKGIRIYSDELYTLPKKEEILPEISPNDLFVMLYTSGSTGKPKGVMFEHSNALVTTEWVKKYFNIDESSKVTSYASYGFDAHAFDIYPAITSGATLHVIGDDIRLDFIALQKYYNDNGITHTVMTTQVGRSFALLGGLRTLKHLSVAGEKLTPFEISEGLNVYNLYGPTEGSIITSAFLIDKKYKDVPIGKAVENLKTYVVDKIGRLLPVGAVGELWISGPHVTRGYLNRPEKTVEAYGENTFIHQKGYERIYRTGDIVRLNRDGNLQFIGRRDAQVKVRGFRVELTEVEEVIRRFNGVKDATVTAFDDPAGGKFICAYVVSDNKIDVNELNSFIRSEKPPYMVPAVTMQIDAIPFNQNQKVNKKALPKPERKAEKIIQPKTDFQKRIFDVVSGVLGHKNFGIENSLYEIGLTSIGAVKLNVELAKNFNVAIKISDIKENDTILRLEKFLSQDRIQEEYRILDDYPITKTQNGIFFECSSDVGGINYNIPLLVKLDDKVDLDKLSLSLKEVLNSHPYIKTTLFVDESGNIRAKRNDNLEPVISIIRTKKVPKNEDLVRSFNLIGDNLYRIEIYKTENGNYLFTDFHHIIFDGTSQSIFFIDLNKAYNGEKLPTENFSGYEIALEEEKLLSSDIFNKARIYYDSVFSSCDADSLPPKTSDSEIKGASQIKKKFTVKFDAVKRYCDENRVTVNAFLNTAFGVALGKFIQYDNVVFTTIYNGRNDSRLHNTISMLVKTLPVLVKTETDKKISSMIFETKEQLINSMANDIYSFGEISNAYGIKANIIFAYQGDEFNFNKLCGYNAQFTEVLGSVAKAPISVSVGVVNNEFTATLDYRTDIFNKEFVTVLLDALNEVIKCFLIKENLSEVTVLSKEAENELEKINDTDREFENIPVNALIERYSKKTPEKTAVIGNGKSITYFELNSLSNKIANKLVELGIKKDTIVALILDRGIEISITELGILKSGGAFLGILPSYPDDRIEFCLSDADVPIVITTETIFKNKAKLFLNDKPYKTLVLEDIFNSVTNDNNPNIEISPDSLAYCIYTSGSTGRPKGVMIEHQNLACCIQPFDFTYRYYCGDRSGDVVLAISSISFDMSVMDNIMMLANGKTVVVATDYEIHNPVALSKLLIDNRVEIIATTPSFLTNYITIPEFCEALKNLKTIVVGAEAFPPVLYDKIKSISPKIHIINGYGPTECTITCSSKELSSGKKVTIGGPSANTKFFVYDKFKNLLPKFGSGELIIGGRLVGRGYVKLPEKTSASFFTLNGIKAYHSGDTVRFNKDGEIEFFGRIDNQIKLRGFRVELDEIENVISSFVGIKQSKVVVRNNGGIDYLAGFFTAEMQIDLQTLSNFLKQKLTYYMVPDVLMQLDEMPLTPSGKIDKKALPEVKREERKKEKRAPKKSLEERLCELFKSVLCVDEYYADDNFFEMGGTSLSASKVTMQLMSSGIKVEYQDIFDNPTPETLAQYVEAQNYLKKEEVKKEDTKQNDILEALKYNTLGYADKVFRKPVGNVLLTGTVGFLGVHVLRELISVNEGKILCIVRKGNASSPEARLKNILMYYFDSTFEKEFNDRIQIIDADITDDNLPKVLENYSFDTLINCAACVKHYASDDIIERINVHGVENLIKCAKAKNAKMIQISTTSVPGVHTEETYKKQIKMHENELFVIDSLDNKYGISKYHAELKMIEAINSGMKGKIIRVGNLMGRHSDGEFQINFNTNAFLHALRGFATIGKCPISHATDPMSFSPIDLTAKAVVLLAGTNDMFTAFNANSRFGFDEMQLIESCNNCGIKITPVDDKEYYSDYYKMLGDEKINGRLSGLVTNDRPDLHVVDTDNLFTANILYRLGFSWPLVDEPYLERTIESLMTLDYFEPDESEDL